MAIRDRETPYFYVGQGRVLLSKRMVDGKPEGYVTIGKISKMDIMVRNRVLEHFESKSNKAYRDEVHLLNTTVDLAMTVEHVSADNIALFYDALLDDVPAGTDHEKVMQVSPGFNYGLDHVDVEAVIITDMGGTITYDSSNFIATLETGSIEILEDQTGATNAITKGQLVKATYSFKDQKHIYPLQGSGTEYCIRFEGVNTAEGDVPVVVECFRVSPNIVGQLAKISNKVIQVDLGCALLEDPFRNEGDQYFREMAVR